MRWSVENSGGAAAGGRTERQSHHQIGRLLKNREVCRVRTCFEGDKLGSELLPPDVLLAERRGILIDTVPLPIRLLLFGTGPEIEPITQLAGNLGWVVECFGHPSELAADFRPDAQTAALVMNHNFGRDLLALDRLLPLPLRYVGLLGPRKRYAELLARLSEYRPLDFEAGTRNLFAPAGLDIGSEAPEEIALSIVSEVAAVLSSRHGGFLRERKSDIHATIAAAAEKPLSSTPRLWPRPSQPSLAAVRNGPVCPSDRQTEVCPCSDLSRPASISKERAHIPPYAIQKNPTATP